VNSRGGNMHRSHDLQHHMSNCHHFASDVHCPTDADISHFIFLLWNYLYSWNQIIHNWFLWSPLHPTETYGHSCFWLAQTIYPHDLLVSVDTVCTVLHRNSSSRMDPIKQCLSWRISVSDCLTFENSSPSFKNTGPTDVLHSNASAKFLNLSRDGHSWF
jgi:hypothetical protein